MAQSHTLTTPAARVVLFSGGRGSGVLSKQLLRDPRIQLTLAINGYDDGASTGEVRRFLGDALVCQPGPVPHHPQGVDDPLRFFDRAGLLGAHRQHDRQADPGRGKPQLPGRLVQDQQPLPHRSDAPEG